MPSGHTDKATINQRRPLTASMREMLATVRRRDLSAAVRGWQQSICWSELTNGEKNCLRGLLDRGYVTTIGDDRHYRETDAGKAVELP